MKVSKDFDVFSAGFWQKVSGLLTTQDVKKNVGRMSGKVKVFGEDL